MSVGDHYFKTIFSERAKGSVLNRKVAYIKSPSLLSEIEWSTKLMHKREAKIASERNSAKSKKNLPNCEGKIAWGVVSFVSGKFYIAGMKNCVMSVLQLLD